MESESNSPLKFVEANYTEQQLPEYNENPLIAALPPILEFRDVEAALQYHPPINDSERQLGVQAKRQCINRLFRFFQPMEKHFEIESRISSSIRQGYLSRNPFSSNYASDLHQIYKSIKEHDSDFKGIEISPSTASGFSIIGISGVGKTTAVRKILSLYPQVIVHKNFNGRDFNHLQIVHMRLDCPPDGSIKGLCSAFFMEFDELLGGNSYAKFASGHNTTTNLMIPRMAQLARRHSLGLLVIDEIQHLSAAKSGGADIMLNFFVTLVNTIGVPIILIGTNKAFPLLQGEFRQARRSGGQQGGLVWEKMKKDEWWQLLIEGLWEYQWTKEKAELSLEMSDLFYDRSQGILDVIVKLFAMAQIKAISLNKDKITPAIVKSAADEGLIFLEPMLKALRSGKKEKIANYEDLIPINIDAFCENQMKNIIENYGTGNTKGGSLVCEKKDPSVNSNPVKKTVRKNKKVKSEIPDSKSGYDLMKETGDIGDPVEMFLKN